jgi:hypothetical protein
MRHAFSAYPLAYLSPVPPEDEATFLSFAVFKSAD